MVVMMLMIHFPLFIHPNVHLAWDHPIGIIARIVLVSSPARVTLDKLTKLNRCNSNKVELQQIEILHLLKLQEEYVCVRAVGLCSYCICGVS